MAQEKNNLVSKRQSLQDTNFKVVSPLGELIISDTTMATRPDTLEGKTVCFTWNGSFKSNVTLPVIAEVLKKKFPTVKVIPYTEMPRASRAPVPGTTNPEQTSLTTAFREKGCDLVISGNGG